MQSCKAPRAQKQTVTSRIRFPTLFGTFSVRSRLEPKNSVQAMVYIRGVSQCMQSDVGRPAYA